MKKRKAAHQGSKAPLPPLHCPGEEERLKELRTFHLSRIHREMIAAARSIAQINDTGNTRLASRAQVGRYTTSENCWTYRDSVVGLVFCKDDLSGVIYRQRNDPAVLAFDAEGSIVCANGDLRFMAAHIKRLMHPLRLLGGAAE